MEFRFNNSDLEQVFRETAKKGEKISEYKRLEEEKIVEEELYDYCESDFLENREEEKELSPSIEPENIVSDLDDLEKSNIVENDETVEYLDSERFEDLEDIVYEMQVNVLGLDSNVVKIKSDVVEISKKQENVLTLLKDAEIKTKIFNLDTALIDMKADITGISKKQEAILDILSRVEKLENSFEKKFIKTEKRKNPNSVDINILRKNLEIFNSKFIIIENNSSNEDIQSFLQILEQISLNINTNYFYIFSTTLSPIREALNMIKDFEKISNYKIDFSETQFILQTVEKISTHDFEFERYLKYSFLVFEKGVLLNSVILLNESITKYILDSIKAFSNDIDKKISEIEEKVKEHKISMGFKNFFIREFLEDQGDTKYEKNMIDIFKENLLNKISDKLKNLHTTAKNKGDGELFKKFSIIIKEVRHLRNNMSHGNMKNGFSNKIDDYPELLQDYKYICLQKDILKIKKNSKKLNS